MNMLTQILWIISYAILAGIAGLVVTEIAALSWAMAGLWSLVLFVLMILVHGAVQRGRERGELDHRLMALYEDYQGALDAVDDLRREISALKDQQARGGTRPDADLVAEIKVLQTLLAQVVRKSGSAPAAAPKSTFGSRADTGGAFKNDEGDAARLEADTRRARGRDEILEIMQNALEDNRVDLYFQPIVRLPSRKPVFYEAYSRVRDAGGQIIFPREYLPLAEESGLVGTLDNLLLFRCIQVIRRLGPRRPNVRFFCNISAASLADKDFFPQFIDFMINNIELADRLVFEFSQASIRAQSREVERSLASLGRRGFQFSMDQVEDLDVDPAGLGARHFRFVKASAELLRTGSGALDKADLREALARYQVDLIAEKIQEEQEVIEVLDYGVEYGQGYLFGEPRPSRDDPPGEDEATERPASPS